MNRHDALTLTFASLMTGLGLGVVGSAVAADVTAQRLNNAEKEPQNWLMNHGTYDSQRYSRLDKINTTNVKGLKLAYAVAIGGTAINENLEATPLAEDGFLYVVDLWGVVYKIDARSGDSGRIVWRMDPGQEKMPDANRGAALWGAFVISVANYPPRVIATNKETGKIAWETNLSDGQANLEFTAAPQAVKDRIILGASGGDKGARDFVVAVDAATGKFAWRHYTVPAPGEPGSETWRDKNNAWQTGGGALWVTGSYDPETNQVLWGTGNPVPWSDPYYRPGDNLYTDSLISWNPDSGKMNWFHQYTPGDMWDYDEEGSNILIDGVIDGQPRKVITHAARNGFLYSFERANGQTVMAKPYVARINWTAGIDQKTGKPVDYDPNRDIQVYSSKQNFTLAEPTKLMCPALTGGNNFFPPSYSKRTGLIYIPAFTMCGENTLDQESIKQGIYFARSGIKFTDRSESDLVMADPITGEIRKRAHSVYPNVSGVLTTAGGLVFTGFADGSLVAYNDASLDQVWKINVGTGFNAPPMTFEAGGKQYVAILTGLSRQSKGRLNLTPELRDIRNQTMLFVFGL
jgi:alcohol dehydrogenase (cytochrome c)